VCVCVCVCVSVIVEMKQPNLRMTCFRVCPPLSDMYAHRIISCSLIHVKSILKRAFALLLRSSEYVWVILQISALLTTLIHYHSNVCGVFFSCSERLTLEKLVYAFITSRVDYCNGLLTGLPKYAIRQLQPILNAAARILSRTRKPGHPQSSSYIWN